MKKFLKLLPKILFNTVCWLFIISVKGQLLTYGTISGKVLDNHGDPIVGAVVSIKETKLEFTTNNLGEYLISHLPAGKYTLIFYTAGYKTHQHHFIIKHQEHINYSHQLEQETHTLQDIVITGKSANQILSDQPIKAEILNTRELQQTSSTLSEALNRTSGVKVRMMGGLGSPASLNINGFSDKAIKFFRDGIPMDYMGYGFNIALLPISMLDRVEIYKGVMPVYLGADALGGGINMVTKTSYKRYIDAAYEISSFNTHRTSLNTYFSDSANRHFVGLDGFFNYSDNNYRVIAKVLDYETSTRTDHTVTRFHDAFVNPFFEISGGWRNHTWADEIKLSLASFYIRRENQHGSLMSDPYGESVSYQKAFIPSIRYRNHLFKDKLTVDQFLVFSRLNNRQVDTCNCVYDWYGKKTAASRGGESDNNGSLSDINFDHYVTRTYISFEVRKNHILEFNNSFSQFTRLGNDPLGSVYYYSGKDILSEKAGYSKWVTGLGLNSTFFNKRLENSISVKRYYFATNGTDGAYNSYEGSQIINSNSQLGFGEAFKFNISSRSFVRMGVEWAYRLPEQAEVFGDGMFLLSNFSLKPEQSRNFNIGFKYESPKRFNLEPNFFYRITRDQINLTPVYIPFSQYQNNEQVKGYGLEMNMSASPFHHIELFGNGTYQSIRLFDLEVANNKFLEGARLRNTPYLFGNLGLRATLPNVLNTSDAIRLSYYFSYTHDFYLTTIPRDKEPKGLFDKAGIETDLIIPTQRMHSASAVYSIPGERISFAIEVKNILNAAIYDNFRVQRAGRSFHIKLRYLLK